MKKTYIAPKAKEYKVSTVDLMATSGEGVATGQSLGGEYSGDDVSYTKGDNTISIWDLY